MSNSDRLQDSSTFYISGFARLGQECRALAFGTLLSSRVAEAFQLQLLEDSRVARNYEALWMSTLQEMKWVVSIDDKVWQMLAAAGPQLWQELKDDVIRASHISLHFIWRRVLAPALELPWRLVRGNIKENLENLAAGDEPTEPASSNLWNLMQLRCPIELLVRIVKLVGEAPWTSLPAEQQHGSLAALRRCHKGYNANT